MVESVAQSRTEIVINSTEKSMIRVLHVDDELGFLKVAKQCLEMQGPFHVDSASSVEEALRELQEEAYDAVVSDYQMPGKDGLQFLRELRSSRNSIPFIIFTGKGREEVAIEALNLGANQYLNKTGDTATVYCELAHGIRQAVEKNKTEEELRRFSSAVKSSLDGIIICDLSGRIIEVNDAITRTYGSTNERELIGKSTFDFLAPEERDRGMEGLEELLKGGSLKRQEYTAMTKSGKRVPAEISVTLLKDSQSKPIGIVSIIRDITERKKAEEKYKMLVEQSLQGIVVAQGSVPHIVFANAAMAKILCYTPEELVSLSPQQTVSLVHPEDRELFFGRFKDRLEGRPAQPNYEVRGIRKDGAIVWLELASTRIDYNGQPAVQATFMDITERKKTEEALKRSEQKYREFADSLPEIAFELDEKGNVTFFNRRASEILGYSHEEIRSMNILQFLIPEDRVRAKENIQKVLEGEPLHGNEYRLLRRDGDTFPVIAFTNRIVREDGKAGVRGVIVNISEQKNIEERLRESEEKFRNLAEQSPNMIFIHSKGRVAYANKEAENAMGYKREEFYSPDFNFLNLIAQESKELAKSSFSEHMKGKDVAPYEYKLATKEGRIIDAVLATKLIIYEGETAILGTVIDITERKKAELELQDSEAKYRSLVQQLPLTIYTISAEDAKITSLNPAFEKITGWKCSEWIGKTFEKLIHPDDLPLAIEAFQKAIHGGTMPPYELRILSKSGEYLVGEFTSGPQIEKGKIVGKFGIVRNITERKKAERAILESQQKFEGLFMANPEAAVFLGPDFRILNINPRFEDLFGHSVVEIRGKHIDDVVVPDGKIDEAKMLNEKAGQGYVYYNSVRRRKDGSLVPVSISAAPIAVGGKITGYVEVYRDITEKKCYEENISTLNTHARDLNLAKSMQEIYELTLDAAQKTLGFEFADILMVEEKMLRLVSHLGYPENGGQGALSLELPLDGDKGITVRAARTGKPVFIPDADKDSAYVDVGLGMHSELAVPIKIGHRVVGVLNAERKELNAFDEKDQQLLEILASHAATAMSNLEYAKNLEAYTQETRESQQKFEGLFMANPEAAVHVGPDFSILNVNPRFEILFGYKLAEVKGRNINDVVVPKDKIDEAQTLDQIAEQDKHVSRATVRRKKDGSLVPVFVSAAPITVEGRFLGYVAVYKDISELKNAEKKLELVNEKLRVTGGLTRHDVRNKLSTVTGNVYLLKKRLVDNSDALDKLKDIENAVQQTVRIFDFARAYEMLGVEELSYIDVAKTLNEAVSLFPGSIDVKVINECRGLVVLADPLLRQLFYNLIDNSLKYGQKVTKIRVYYEETDQDNLKLVYEDDGVGISAAEKPKLFKEGYSTGGGTGYGLYLISKIVEVYGWTIQENGTPSKGTQFTMAIPKVNKNGREGVRLG